MEGLEGIFCTGTGSAGTLTTALFATVDDTVVWERVETVLAKLFKLLTQGTVETMGLDARALARGPGSMVDGHDSQGGRIRPTGPWGVCDSAGREASGEVFCFFSSGTTAVETLRGMVGDIVSDTRKGYVRRNTQISHCSLAVVKVFVWRLGGSVL